MNRSISSALFSLLLLVPAGGPFPGNVSVWKGYKRYDFRLFGRACVVVAPGKAAPGKPWIWRARFFGHEPQVDLALLRRGWHLVYIDVAGLYGAPKATALWDKFYEWLVKEKGFARRAVLEGMSRGGLVIFNWAKQNPDKVAAIYGDAPVCDIRSWPGGKGAGKGSRPCWMECLKVYGLPEEGARDFRGNPLDGLGPMAKSGVPVLVVYGEADKIVPPGENCLLFARRYKELGGEIELIGKPGVGHHPHCLKDPAPIVDFILRHSSREPKEPARAARRLFERVLGERARDFQVEILPARGGKDFFEVETRDGKVVIRGTTPVAAATGLGWYLKYKCRCEAAWCGNRIDLPRPLPALEKKVRKEFPYRHRTYLNYCTFGYTMAWWDWRRWEREIDLMALNGIDMPLQIVGLEAVWLEAFKKFGLTEKELLEFLVGPPYFPWAWMANVDSIGGPLPISWIRSHLALGRKILERERSLGMKPVLQGFSGRVPGAFRKHHPKCRIRRQRPWGGIPGTWQMDPTDPMFVKAGSTFIRTEIELLGSDHYYAADPFHEGAPPSREPGYLGRVGARVYKAMEEADPSARWVMQSWSLREKILMGAPGRRVVVFDLNGKRSFPRKGVPFWGRDTFWGVLNNFGGRNYVAGNLREILGRCGKRGEYAPNLVGFGLFDEGIEVNPVVFDALYENTWRDDTPDPVAWTAERTLRRYGADLPALKEAWRLLLQSAYKRGWGYDSALRARPALTLEKSSPCLGSVRPPYDNKVLCRAWGKLLEGADRCASAPGWRFDLVDTAQQCLNNYGYEVHKKLAAAFRRGDEAGFDAAAKEMKELILDIDGLLAAHPMFLLGKWVKDARGWGADRAEADLYERNALALLTVWEYDYIPYFDYSARAWAGLYKDFYLPRWEKFFRMLREKLRAGELTYDDAKLKRKWNRPLGTASPFYREMEDFEKAFTRGKKTWPAEPAGDLVRTARRLYKKYAPRIQQKEK